MFKIEKTNDKTTMDKQMKRFMLMAGEQYESNSGSSCIVGKFGTIDECKQYFKTIREAIITPENMYDLKFDWGEIIDITKDDYSGLVSEMNNKEGIWNDDLFPVGKKIFSKDLARYFKITLISDHKKKVFTENGQWLEFQMKENPKQLYSPYCIVK